MARGDVFVVGDRIEYRTSYKKPARYGVVIGFARDAVVVRFDESHQVKTIRAASAWLRRCRMEVASIDRIVTLEEADRLNTLAHAPTRAETEDLFR